MISSCQTSTKQSGYHQFEHKFICVPNYSLTIRFVRRTTEKPSNGTSSSEVVNRQRGHTRVKQYGDELQGVQGGAGDGN